MHYPIAYTDYLIQFHAQRDYFECHELLEEYWKEHPDDGYSNFWLALIQVAVGQYHERRGNRKGAMKMYSASIQKLTNEPDWRLGLHTSSLVNDITERVAACQNAQHYTDINLKLDELLEQFCVEQSKERNLQWKASSMNVSEYIIHRHIRRDRSEVVLAREEALRLRKQARESKRKE